MEQLTAPLLGVTRAQLMAAAMVPMLELSTALWLGVSRA